MSVMQDMMPLQKFCAKAVAIVCPELMSVEADPILGRCNSRVDLVLKRVFRKSAKHCQGRLRSL